jgi:hypothetical protein
VADTPVAAASAGRSARRSFRAFVTSGRRYPIALAVCAWVGAAGFVVGGYALESLREVSFVVTGGALALAWRLVSRSAADEPDGGRGYGRSSWLGVGALPVAYAAVALGHGNAIVHVVFGAVVGVIAIVLGAMLFSDGGRLVLGSGFALSPLMEAIAVREPVAVDATTDAERRVRRRRIDAVESLLTILSFAILAFSSVLAFLAANGYGVHVTPARLHGWAAQRAAFVFVLWHLADLVPFLDVPHTVHWQLHHDFTDHWSGVLVLVLKVFVAVPILRTAAKLWHAADDC